jgi:hypothetical protein
MIFYKFLQVMRILLQIVINYKRIQPSTFKIMVNVIFYNKASTFH